MSIRPRMRPEDALRLVSSFINEHPPLTEELMNAIDDIGAFIQDMGVPPDFNPEDLVILLETAEWQPGPEPGEEVAYCGGSKVADALAWECTTCRPDVGWDKHSHATRNEAGEIGLYVQCGHCGHQMYYDAYGDEVGD